MNLAKFHRLKEEATQLNAAARNLNERVREAHTKKFLANQELETVRRDGRNETQFARLAAEAKEATAEFEQLHRDALSAAPGSNGDTQAPDMPVHASISAR